jgi:site-specific recombinase XerD
VRRHATALVSDPTRDHAYRATQLGAFVAGYLSWMENDQGAKETTLDSYERVLARVCVALDEPAAEVTTIELRGIRDSFTLGQRRKATAVIRSYFRWLYDEQMIERNPADRLRAPRRQQRLVETEDLYSDEEKAAIVTAQTDIMDRVGVLLLLRAGLRQAELRGLRVQDINLVEKYVIVRRGKGGVQRRVPIKGELIRALEELFLTDVPGLSRPRQSDEFLLCPKKGGGRSRVRDPQRPMGKRGAHRMVVPVLALCGDR